MDSGSNGEASSQIVGAVEKEEPPPKGYRYGIINLIIHWLGDTDRVSDYSTLPVYSGQQAGIRCVPVYADNCDKYVGSSVGHN